MHLWSTKMKEIYNTSCLLLNHSLGQAYIRLWAKQIRGLSIIDAFASQVLGDCGYINLDPCFSVSATLSMLAGKFWDLKSTHLKAAEIEKHWSRWRIQYILKGNCTEASEKIYMCSTAFFSLRTIELIQLLHAFWTKTIQMFSYKINQTICEWMWVRAVVGITADR